MWLTTLFAGAIALGINSIPASVGAQEYEYNEYNYEDDRGVRNMVRFRFGISGVGGGLVNGPDIGLGGASLRFGAQFGDFFAVYYQGTGLVGSFVDREAGVDTAAGLLFNAAMAEGTFGNFLSVGVGPSVDYIWGCNRDYQGETECSTDEAYFGLNGRVALNFAHHGTHNRHGFTLSAEVHPTFFTEDDVGITVLGGLGYEMF